MDAWIETALVVAVIVGWLALRRLGLIGAAEAQRWLAEGAVVVDVRSPAEFAAGHVTGAINVPLGELNARIGQAVPDKSRPLLVHCLSGGRSALARRSLLSQGYTRVQNLGSLGRARNIVESKRDSRRG